jgi:hypothetical protein
MWHVESQQRSRRNALLASTALTQLSHERREVEEFLDEHARRRHPAESEVGAAALAARG